MGKANEKMTSRSRPVARTSSVTSVINDLPPQPPPLVLPAYLSGGLTRLFNELDRDQDGYLMASDLNLLARVILGQSVSEVEARSELQTAKALAEKKIGAKKTFQKDVLCLEEFLACSWFLDSVPESMFENTITQYVEAIRRVTGAIPHSELIMLRMAREQRRQQLTEEQRALAGSRNKVTAQPSFRASNVDLLRMRSQKNLFAE